MPTVEFEIDDQGAMTMDIHGETGKACDTIENIVTSMTRPQEVRVKPEYYQCQTVREQIRRP